MAMMLSLSTALTVVNLLLILSLLFVYVKNAAKIKSLFTLGLIIFALLFLIQNAVSLYFTITMMPFYGDEVQGYGMIFTILQTVAFTMLNIITWR